MKRILCLVAMVVLASVPAVAMDKPGIMTTLSVTKQANVYHLKQDTVEGRVWLDPLPIPYPLPSPAIGATSSGWE